MELELIFQTENIFVWNQKSELNRKFRALAKGPVFNAKVILELRLLEKLEDFGKLVKCRNSETLPKLYESLIKKLAKLWSLTVLERL
ncbi:hypothetical protein RhiirA4_455156 [Rhizophagus irregularis]|uniref:Uncharacterized protein n=1 Tax=Rhizophagus irregularis TaxID=588596 RepID=A0A2I1G4J0_9GLOM|nr:hypothetical protein RhiirA4_455156 [Rhizophagus irregularis]